MLQEAFQFSLTGPPAPIPNLVFTLKLLQESHGWIIGVNDEERFQDVKAMTRRHIIDSLEYTGESCIKAEMWIEMRSAGARIAPLTEEQKRLVRF